MIGIRSIFLYTCIFILIKSEGFAVFSYTCKIDLRRGCGSSSARDIFRLVTQGDANFAHFATSRAPLMAAGRKAEYWFSLNEEERSAESQKFHSFLVERGFLGRTISRWDAKLLFSEFCEETGARPGYNIMSWKNVMFIMRILEACRRSGDRQRFTILEWPERYSRPPRVALHQYMAERKEKVHVEVGAGVGGGSREERVRVVMREMREHRLIKT